METNDIKKEDVWVDITKIWCVFIVAMGHCWNVDIEGLKWISEYVATCVQMMFIFSGYYFVRNRSLQTAETAKRYIGHLVTMVLAWEGIYFLWDIRYTQKTTAGWFYQYVMDYVENFCSLNGGHLWYLQNLLLLVLLLYGLKKERYGWKEVIFFLIVVSFIPKRLLRAAAGVLFGGFLAQNKKKATKGNTAGLFIASMVLSALMAQMYYIEFDFSDVLYLSIIQLLLNLAAMALSWWAVNMDELYPINAGAAGYYIRKIATGIYLIHMLFIQPAISVASHHAAWGETKFLIYYVAYTIAFSIAFSLLLIWLSKRDKFRWLKHLY